MKINKTCVVVIAFDVVIIVVVWCFACARVQRLFWDS